MSAGVFDYSDGRVFSGKPLAAHLRPDYWPTQKRQTVTPIVKVRRGGKIISAITLGEDSDLISLVQNI